MDHSPGAREYRRKVSSEGLVSFSVTVQESDLLVSAEENLSRDALEALLACRRIIESYGASRADFFSSLVPVADDPVAPAIIRSMLKASRLVEVGPMAAVAGAVSEYVGNVLGNLSRNIIVENGGDLYLRLFDREGRVALHAGSSPLSEKIHLNLQPCRTPLALCTSSGTVGPSLSFGKADLVSVISSSGALADAAATALCNRVRHRDDIRKTLDHASTVEGIRGVIIIIGDALGAWGEVEFH